MDTKPRVQEFLRIVGNRLLDETKYEALEDHIFHWSEKRMRDDEFAGAVHELELLDGRPELIAGFNHLIPSEYWMHTPDIDSAVLQIKTLNDIFGEVGNDVFLGYLSLLCSLEETASSMVIGVDIPVVVSIICVISRMLYFPMQEW